MAGDVGVVAVVARVLAQLRGAAVEVADLQLQADHEAADAQQHGDQHRAGRPLGRGEAVEQVPQLAQAAMLGGVGVDDQRPLGGLGADADIGQRHRHHQQGGEDQHGDADAGGDRQLLDHRDIDQHQHGEAHRVGEQRGDPGDEQAAEGVARRHQLVGAAGDVLHDAVHLLRGMRHADGEDQEGHQDRVGIDGVAQPGDDAQLPDHRGQRAEDHQQGAADAAGVQQDDEEGTDHRQAEEHHHLNQPVDQVAHQLGEADHPHLVLAAALLAGLARGAVAGELVLVAQLLLEHPRELVVVDAAAGGRVLVEQRHDQHGRSEVAGHQTADDAGTVDVLAQLLDVGRRARVVVGHHRTALEALLGDLGPAHRRAPQRLHPGAVDALGEKQLVVDLLEHVQVLGVEDVALGVLHHHPHRIAQAAQRLAVLQVVLDVGLALRNHLLEAGAQLQAGNGHVAQQGGDQQHEQDEQRPVVEHQAFQQVAGARVELTQVADHRHGVLLDIAHVWVLALYSYRYSTGSARTPRSPTSTRLPALSVAAPVTGARFSRGTTLKRLPPS
ncbi:hypothetical protein D3C84_357410 [compost metagenome]